MIPGKSVLRSLFIKFPSSLNDEDKSPFFICSLGGSEIHRANHGKIPKFSESCLRKQPFHFPPYPLRVLQQHKTRFLESLECFLTTSFDPSASLETDIPLVPSLYSFSVPHRVPSCPSLGVNLYSLKGADGRVRAQLDRFLSISVNVLPSRNRFNQIEPERYRVARRFGEAKFNSGHFRSFSPSPPTQ